MSPTRGWALKGERLVCAVPHGHWHTTTFLCGLRTTGLVAPLVLDGAINGPAFLAYVRQFLAPELSPPGDIVVLDTLNSHKVSGVREAIRGALVGGVSVSQLARDYGTSRQTIMRVRDATVEA